MESTYWCISWNCWFLMKASLHRLWAIWIQHRWIGNVSHCIPLSPISILYHILFQTKPVCHDHIIYIIIIYIYIYIYIYLSPIISSIIYPILGLISHYSTTYVYYIYIYIYIYIHSPAYIHIIPYSYIYIKYPYHIYIIYTYSHIYIYIIYIMFIYIICL